MDMIFKCLTQTAPCIIKPVDGRFDCSFSTDSGKFDQLKIDIYFSVFQKNTQRTYKTTYYTSKSLSFMLVLPQNNIYLEN